jgi:hypothetical protein
MIRFQIKVNGHYHGAKKKVADFHKHKICALFDLRSGVALSYGIGNKKSHELPLLREQISTFKCNDIFLGDKGFVSYFDMTNLLRKEVDTIVGLTRCKPVTVASAKKVITTNDLIVEWKKPKSSRPRYEANEWDQLPDHLLVRQIKVTVDRQGYRAKEFYIATTLLDPKKYPAANIASLYLKRWKVELYCRDNKEEISDTVSFKSSIQVLSHYAIYLFGSP